VGRWKSFAISPGTDEAICSSSNPNHPAFSASQRHNAFKHRGQRDIEALHIVHATAVRKAGFDTLFEGDTVTFDVVESRGKPVADNLRVK
jgi:cold shock CspA family protein